MKSARWLVLGLSWMACLSFLSPLHASQIGTAGAKNSAAAPAVATAWASAINGFFGSQTPEPLSLSPVLSSLDRLDLKDAAVRTELAPVYQAIQAAAARLLNEQAPSEAAATKPEVISMKLRMLNETAFKAYLAGGGNGQSARVEIQAGAYNERLSRDHLQKIDAKMKDLAEALGRSPEIEAPAFDNSRIYPIVIIGGGPAGLSIAERLKERGIEAPILERGPGPGQSWKNMPTRLKLLSPPSQVLLPNTPADIAPRETFPPARRFARYLADYAAHHDLNIIPHSEVFGVEKEQGLLTVHTNHGPVKAHKVVNATGYYAKPFIPEFAGAAESSIPQIHFADYKDAEQVASMIGSKGKVLIVGKGLSAGQAIEELALDGFSVTLSARGEIKFLPPNPWGDWFEAWALPVLEKAILKLGLGHFEPPTVPMAPGKARQLIRSGQVPVRSDIARFDGREVVFKDDKSEAFDLVLYATGFRPALDHLPGLSRDAATGSPSVRNMESRDIPGLFFLGLSGQPTFRSRFLRGIRDDAEALAKILAPTPGGDIHTRGLRSLLSTHFLSGFADTAVATLFATWATATLPASTAGLYIGIATAVFVAPYLLLSFFAGRLADRFDKARIVALVRVGGLATSLVAAAAFALGAPVGVIGAMLLMGILGSIVSPAKYGLLPERVPASGLSKANGTAEMLTFLGLIGGTVLGGLLYTAMPGQLALAGALLLVPAGASLAAAVRLRDWPRNAEPQAELQADAPDAAPKSYLTKAIATAALGGSIFWFFATLMKMNLFLYAEHSLKVGQGVLTGLLATQGIGIGLGCYAAGRWSRGRVELGLVPIGAAAVVLALADMTFFGLASLPRVFADIAVVCFGAGLFFVPLRAFIQLMSPPESRGRIQAFTNFVGLAGTLLAAGAFIAMTTGLGLSPVAIFVAFTGLSAVAAAGTFIALRKPLARLLGLRS